LYASGNVEGVSEAEHLCEGAISRAWAGE